MRGECSFLILSLYMEIYGLEGPRVEILPWSLHLEHPNPGEMKEILIFVQVKSFWIPYFYFVYSDAHQTILRKMLKFKSWIFNYTTVVNWPIGVIKSHCFHVRVCFQQSDVAGVSVNYRSLYVYSYVRRITTYLRIPMFIFSAFFECGQSSDLFSLSFIFSGLGKR